MSRATVNTPKDRALAALLGADDALARLAAHERWPSARRERPELGHALLAVWEGVARASEDLIDGRAKPGSGQWRAREALSVASRIAEQIGAGP